MARSVARRGSGYVTDMNGIVATASIDIEAPASRVWTALTEPDQIAAYMFGSRVETDWEVGHPITWNGEWEGKPYQDKGQVLAYDEPERLSVTHFSPLTGQDDVPENYHRLTYSLEREGDATRLTLEQDNTPEESVEDFQSNWDTMLGNLKELVERG